MENETLDKLKVMKEFIDNQYTFTKTLILENLELDKSTDTLNAKLKSIKLIKDKFNNVFNKELFPITNDNIDEFVKDWTEM